MGQKATKLEKKAEKKAAKAEKAEKAEKKAVVPATDAPPIQATGEATDAPVLQAPAKEEKVAKTPRIKKNATTSTLDVSDPNSAMTWLAEFIEQGKNHPPIKGYDQHWNSDGFIHAGPGKRLPNIGAAKMIVFLGDVFARRSI